MGRVDGVFFVFCLWCVSFYRLLLSYGFIRRPVAIVWSGGVRYGFIRCLSVSLVSVGSLLFFQRLAVCFCFPPLMVPIVLFGGCLVFYRLGFSYCFIGWLLPTVYSAGRLLFIRRCVGIFLLAACSLLFLSGGRLLLFFIVLSVGVVLSAAC